MLINTAKGDYRNTHTVFPTDASPLEFSSQVFQKALNTVSNHGCSSEVIIVNEVVTSEVSCTTEALQPTDPVITQGSIISAE